MRRLLLSIILICVLTIPASAHPGGTDGNGGHTNHSTGDYHYHHGYGAHEHEDLDGDGELDCPYDFKDKTGQNSGESSGSTTRYPAYIGPVEPLPAVPAPTIAEPEREEQAEIGILGVLLLLCSPIIFFSSLGAIVDFINALRVRKENNRKHQPRRERSNSLCVPLWKSVQDGMEHTRIKDKYIEIEDLEYAALYWDVNLDAALKMLNDERELNGLRSFKLKGE